MFTNTYLKAEITAAINQSFAELKDRISSDILNYELNTLYSNMIYGPEVEIVQNKAIEISERIDNILNKHWNNCLEDIEVVLDKVILEK